MQIRRSRYRACTQIGGWNRHVRLVPACTTHFRLLRRDPTGFLSQDVSFFLSFRQACRLSGGFVLTRGSTMKASLTCLPFCLFVCICWQKARLVGFPYRFCGPHEAFWCSNLQTQRAAKCFGPGFGGMLGGDEVADAGGASGEIRSPRNPETRRSLGGISSTGPAPSLKAAPNHPSCGKEGTSFLQK